MNAKQIFAIAAIIAVANAAFARLLSTSSSYVVNVPYNAFFFNGTKLLPLEGEVIQDFTVTKDGFNQLDVRLSRGTARCSYELALSRENEKLASAAVSDESIPQGSPFRRPAYDSFVSLRFKPLPDSAGDSFALAISPLGACAAGGASASYAANVQGVAFALSRNGVSVPGELLMRFGFE